MRPLSVLALILLLGAAGCGDDSAGDASSTTFASTTAGSEPTTTTLPATTSTAVTPTTESSTTTTAPSTTTTTAAPTTTEPADAHPIYGESWAEFWPLPDGATAEYDVTHRGETYRLASTYNRNVEFLDGTWDRFALGTLETGADGLAMYFDSPEPWVVRFAGWEWYRPDGGYTVEYYVDPVTFDLRGDGLTPMEFETTAHLDFEGSVLELGAVFTSSVDGIRQTIETPAGDLTGIRFSVDVGGELMGGDFVFEVDLALVRGAYWIVEMTNSPGYEHFIIVSPWS